jgi:translin
MRQYFDAQEQLRERVLKLSREIIRASARAIAAMHRGDVGSANEFLANAHGLLSQLNEVVKVELTFAESGLVQTARQEYCEAVLVKSLTSERKIPSPEELGIPYKPYLAALADTTGELRRHALDSIRANEVERAERMLKLMEQIFELLMEFDYPDAILPGMKRRQDMVRRVLERTRGDLTIALRQQRLERALERGGK